MKIKEVLGLKEVETHLYDEILDVIYNILNFDFSYKILENKEDLSVLKEEKFHVCVHFKDPRYMIVFCKINGVKYTFLVSKNEIKRDRKYTKKYELRIYYLTNFENIDFENVILDGKLISKSSKNEFLITDIYGKEYNKMKLSEKRKILLANQYLFKSDKKFNFKLANLYTYEQIPDLLFKSLKNTNFSISGLVFLPEYSGKYYLFINVKEFEDLQKGKIPERKKKYNYSKEMFIMEKTSLIDVYELYDKDTKEKIDIAHIPDIKTSLYYRNEFKNTNSIEVYCLKSEKFNKWIPLCDDRLVNDIII